MILIKLTHSKEETGSSDYHYINPLWIQGISPYFDKYTMVKCVGSKYAYKVEETPEEVIQLIKDSGLSAVLDKLGLNGLI